MKWPKVSKKKAQTGKKTYKQAVVERGAENGWEIFEKYDKDGIYVVRIRRPHDTTLTKRDYRSYERAYAEIWDFLRRETWDDDHPERKVL